MASSAFQDYTVRHWQWNNHRFKIQDWNNDNVDTDDNNNNNNNNINIKNNNGNNINNNQYSDNSHGHIKHQIHNISMPMMYTTVYTTIKSGDIYLGRVHCHQDHRGSADSVTMDVCIWRKCDKHSFMYGYCIVMITSECGNSRRLTGLLWGTPLVTGAFLSQRKASNAEFWYFWLLVWRDCWTNRLNVIWDAMALILCYWNDHVSMLGLRLIHISKNGPW